MSVRDLQQRVDEWVAGEILLDQSDRLLDEATGEPLRLGLLVDGPFGLVVFIVYNLGFGVIPSDAGAQHVLYIGGFEDGTGQRFAFPFHSGGLTSACPMILLRVFEGNRINRGSVLSSESLSTEDFLANSDDLLDHVDSTRTSYESIGWPENECQELENNYILSAAETTKALADFLQCEGCTVEEVPQVLETFINSVPNEFDSRIPYIRNYNLHR